MKSAMELSLYPLASADLGAAIDEFLSVLRERGLEVAMGPMSSMVYGETAELFSAIGEAYEAVCRNRGAVLIIKASNACPVA
jgi:uncharacterized protein YqgV (UPF0045/DUF77 family)